MRRWPDPVEWIADRIDGDAVVVLTRRYDPGLQPSPPPIDGRRLVFRDFAEQILGPGDHAIDDVLFEAVLEIVEPAGHGVRLDLPWADGLVDAPSEVEWHGDAIEQAARRRG